MDKQLLYSTIENGHGLRTEELEAMVQQYPWFSTAHLLLSKRYFEAHDHRFTEQLQRTALVAADRKVLYQLIHHTPPPSHPMPVETLAQLSEVTIEPVRLRFHAQDVIEFQPAALVDNSAKLVEEILSEEHSPTMAPAEELVSALPDLLARAVPESLIPSTHQKPQEPSEETTTELELEAPVAVKEDNQDEVTTSPVVRLKDLDPLQQEALLEAVQSSIELEVGEDVGTASEELADAPTTFAEWMAHRAKVLSFAEQTKATEQTQVPATQKEDEEESENVSKNTNGDDHSAQARARLAKESTHHPLKPREGKQEDLIDRFIRLEPRIAPGKATEYSSGNLAKESLEEDFSFVTETMAQLFAKQGKLDKARKVYRKLMAEHPEKSVYFAAQLKKLDSYKKG